MSEETAKTYELRELSADDLFPVCTIISKIGLKEFRKCFDAESVKGVIDKANGKIDAEDIIQTVGFSVIFDIAAIILENLQKCRDNLYSLLASLAGQTVNDIANLPMATFAEMIMDVIQKKEFKDFFRAVTKFLK